MEATNMQTGHNASKDLKESKLATIRREMELTHCPKCGEPFDLVPCCRWHQTRNDELLVALKAAQMLFAKDPALDRFDWGKSFLRAQDIRELNELPFTINRAIAKAEEQS
jgi:hypothetical protein